MATRDCDVTEQLFVWTLNPKLNFEPELGCLMKEVLRRRRKRKKWSGPLTWWTMATTVL